MQRYGNIFIEAIRFGNVNARLFQVKRHEMEQHLSTAVVQHQIKQNQIVKTLRDENKTLKHENKAMRDENNQIKESLHLVNSALIRLFSSQSEDLVSSCGKAILRFTVSNGMLSYAYQRSKHFFAHSIGYKVALDIWSMDDDLCATLIPVCGERDHELRWPFSLRHTITLVGRQHHEDDIKMTIDPATLDDELIKDYFDKPRRGFRPVATRVHNLRCTTASLRVSLYVLFTEKYLKNEEFVIVVEVDN